MSDDGARSGMTAEDGMKAAIGGVPPKKTMDPVELERYVMAQAGSSDYSGTASYAAKLILQHLRAKPEDIQIPTEPQYSDGAAGFAKLDVRNLLDVMHESPGFAELDLTFFMWGWAVNAARTICEMPPVPNPAIMTLR